MSVITFLRWLQQTPWAVDLKESALMFPLVEGSHILALSFSVALIVLFDLRLLGVSFRRQAVSLIMDQTMQWGLPGFGVMFFTGALLFSTEAVRAYGNTFFRAKMILLLLAGVNALYYRFRYQPKMAEWELTQPPIGVRVIAAISLILWVAVITCGRTMAYEL
jgi:hypothetical protein